jgi:hypothetical protein
MSSKASLIERSSRSTLSSLRSSTAASHCLRMRLLYVSRCLSLIVLTASAADISAPESRNGTSSAPSGTCNRSRTSLGKSEPITCRTASTGLGDDSMASIERPERMQKRRSRSDCGAPRTAPSSSQPSADIARDLTECRCIIQM